MDTTFEEQARAAVEAEYNRAMMQEDDNMRMFASLVRGSIGMLVRGLRTVPYVNQRWVSIARTHFQEGFMALDRAMNGGDDDAI